MLVTDTLGFSCISTGAKGQWVETRENMEKSRFPSSGGLGSQAVRNTRIPSTPFSFSLRVSTLKPVRFSRSGGEGRNSLLGRFANGTKNDAYLRFPVTSADGGGIESHGYVEVAFDERELGRSMSN